MAGNITIIEPRDHFQKVPREIIENDNIDHVTLALYVRILHLGKNWNLNIKGLASRFRLGSYTIRRSINLLEKEGYIRRQAVRDTKSGKMQGWDYYVYAEPLSDEELTALSIHRNTDDTEIRMTPKDNIIRPEYISRPNNNKRPKAKRSVFIIPSVEEVAAYCAERHNNIDPEAFVDFYESKGWKVGSAPMKDWKAAVRTWEKRHHEEDQTAKTETISTDDFITRLTK